MINIKNTLRQDSAQANGEDVLSIKKALLKTGHYEIPEYGLTPYPDKSMFRAIKNFQKDNNLKADGIITPNGETLNSLNSNEEDPGVRSPTIWCPQCGGPHGGSSGDLCPDCDSKN